MDGRSDSVRDEHKDGGVYGWVVVGASHICCAFMFGMFPAIGPLFVAIQENFDETSSRVSWVISLGIFLQFAFGPFANICVKKIGFRLSVMIGTAISSAGFFLSGFAGNVEHLYISFGVLIGLGYGFIIAPASSIFAYYIKKRFAVANAIALLGSAVGTTVFPQIWRRLIDAYGWRGAVIVFSAINAHMFISAALFVLPEDRKEGRGRSESREVLEEDPKAHVPEKGLLRKFVHCCDCMLFTKYPSLIVFACSLFFGVGIGYYGSPAHAVARGEVMNLGTRQEIALVATAIGVGSVIGRITVPLILLIDRRHLMTSPRLYGLCLVTLGLVDLLSAFCETYVSYLIYASTSGFLSGMIMILLVQVLKDMVGYRMLLASIALSTPVEATGGLLGPPCAGWIYDETGDYNNSFYFYGASLIFAGTLMLIVEPITTRRQKKRKEGETCTLTVDSQTLNVCSVNSSTQTGSGL